MGKKIICTVCPIGCELTWHREDGEILISGNKCPRGEKYGLSELTNPTRTLTTSVRVAEGIHALVPVRSTKPIPKGELMQAVRELAKVTLTAPIAAGSVVLRDWKGVDFITTRKIPKAGA